MPESYDLNRFRDAQEKDFEKAQRELRNGRKQSHWMWYMFPQMLGLGQSAVSIHYAIKSKKEAIAYLDDPLLGTRLKSLCQTLLNLPDDDAGKIFGSPDNMKLKSSMTLFDAVAGEETAFKDVLDKYFHGDKDQQTLRLLMEADT